MRKKSLIVEANERVSIALVCRWVGVELEDGLEGRSVKTYCPFGRFYHSDGGKEPAFRIYPESNSAYCFSCKKYFTPTALASDAWDVPKKTAARDLLEKIGYKPATAEDVWNEVQEKEPEPDVTMLSMALKTYCKRIDPQWEKNQFDPTVAAVLDRCFVLLDRVKTIDDSDRWLTACKNAMKNTIEQRNSA